MKLRRLLGAAALGSFLLLSVAVANIAPLKPETAGGAVRLLDGAEVSLEREVVEIRQGRGNAAFRVIATFWLRSEAERPLQMPVGFPLPTASLEETGQRVVDTFVVLVDGESTPLEVVDGDTGEETVWATWSMDWLPGQQRVVTCIYDVLFGQPVRGLVSGRTVRYRVSTGRTWKGSIDEAIFRYRGWTDRFGEPMVFHVSHPDNVTQRGERSVTWQFTNWVPGDEDLSLSWLHWNGLVPRTYELVGEYAGGTRRYDDAWLESLVDRELRLPEQVFPERVAELDRSAVRAWIAEHLLMEIRARNGDPFIRGPSGWRENLAALVGMGLEPGPGESVRDGLRYSDWHRYFAGDARLSGRSYEPDPALLEGVGLSDLTGLERDNAEYLSRIVAGSRGDASTR